MAYNSYLYLLIFLPIVFVLYLIVPKRIKWLVLLVSSYAFYAVNSLYLIVFLLISTLTIYFGGLWLNHFQSGFEAKKKGLEREERKKLKADTQRKKRLVTAFILTINFGLLLLLKYWDFFGGIASGLVSLFGGNLGFQPIKIMLPLGISFYTLQAASYIIDINRGKYSASKNLGKVALFLAFFPQIVEGPIGRFDLLADQLYEGHSFDYRRVAFGVQLILWGLFKKIVIADRANMLVTAVFKSYFQYSGAVVVLAMLLYTLQLYAEFSGCMDIVTGSAQLFGVQLSSNFERPFFSKSVNEFWRRWHITLGAWLRDYIFYSVSLSKTFMKLSKWTQKHFNAFFGSLVPAAFALFFVWFGNGFWHGSGWKYITYGLYYYVLMLLGMNFEPLFRKFFEKTKINRKGKGFSVFQILRTFVIVNFGMLMFRADTLTIFGKMVGAMFTSNFFVGLSGPAAAHLGLDYKDYIVLGIGTVIIFVVGLLQEKGHNLRAELAAKPLALRWAVYFAAIFIVLIFGAYGDNYMVVPFIYGQF